MNLRENEYELSFERGSFRPFEQRMIASGLCDMVLPMSFATLKDREVAKYDCSGFVAVRDMEGITFNLAFELLSKMLVTYSKSSEFFINPRRMKIGIDTVYYHMRSGAVRIAYVPEEEEDVNTKVIRFVEELSKKTNEETAAYLDKIFDNIDKYNFKLKDMASYIMQQRRKICGIIEQ